MQYRPSEASDYLFLRGGSMIRILISSAFALVGLATVAQPVRAQSDVFSVGDVAIQRYTPKQLENLVAPVALYPDALLAQVLIASTFPDQVEEAAQYVRLNGTALLDEQEWDISVRSVAHYPSAINMMADKIDWTATLGRAYAFQSSEVMAAVQRMRAMAAEQGNLVSTEQQQVIQEQGNYVIVPAQPQIIYVPVYDPVVIYTRPVFSVGFSTRYWSFGVGFPIGGWLNYDLDWRVRRVYYNGWADNYIMWGGGWRVRSRPFIQITNIYVNPRYTNVYVNRSVTRRPINYSNVDRFGRVNRDTWFGDGRNSGRSAEPRRLPPVASPQGYTRGGNNQSVGGNRDGNNNGANNSARGNANGNRNGANNSARGNNNGNNGGNNSARGNNNGANNGRSGNGSAASGTNRTPPSGGSSAKPRTARPGETTTLGGSTKIGTPKSIVPPKATDQRSRTTPPATAKPLIINRPPTVVRPPASNRSQASPPPARTSNPPAARSSSGTQRSSPPGNPPRSAQKRGN